jgi:dephospho-CoA kinase
MRIIALTGGIATGKTTVSERWSTKIPVIDADFVSHKVMARKSIKDKIVAMFGAQILIDDQIDRKILGEIIFSNAQARADLELIMHPCIQQCVDVTIEWLKEMNFNLICYDVPLLFETNIENNYDSIVVVNCNPEIQLSRLMQRNKLSEYDALMRINAQVPMKLKVSRADYVIDNSTSLENLYMQADTILSALQATSK